MERENKKLERICIRLARHSNPDKPTDPLPAYLAAPGIAVHRQYNLWVDPPKPMPGWTVTHIPTGLSLIAEPLRPLLHTRERAVEVARTLAPLANWPSITREQEDAVRKAMIEGTVTCIARYQAADEGKERKQKCTG